MITKFITNVNMELIINRVFLNLCGCLLAAGKKKKKGKKVPSPPVTIYRMLNYSFEIRSGPADRPGNPANPARPGDKPVKRSLLKTKSQKRACQLEISR